MLSWTSPSWLLALLVIPLVYLLHQLNIQGIAKSVSSLLFWKTSSIAPQSFRRGAKADPIWMLRAMIAGLIVLALAGPSLPDDSQRIVQIWFDDAYSLNTQEPAANQGRLTLLIDALLDKLDKFGTVKAKVYSLRNPANTPLLLDAQTKMAWPEQLRKWIKIQSTPVSAPLAGQIDANVESWLVTDGADPELNHSIGLLPVHQIVLVGDTTENSALTLLSVRPSPQQPDKWQGIFRINHFGDSDTNRTVELWSGNQKLQQWQLHLTPEQSQVIDFVFDYPRAHPFPLIVRLSPVDMLEQDDQLSLLLPPPMATKIYGNCSPSLIAAVRAHPFLQTDIPNNAAAGLNIVCGDTVVESAGATLRFHQADGLQKIETPPVWSDMAGRMSELQLPENLIRQVQPSGLDRKGMAVLLSDSIPLVTLTEAASRLVDCYIDMGSEEFSKQAEYPLFFAGLADLAVNQSLLNPIATVARESDASRVKPLPLVLSDTPSAKSSQPATLDVAPWLILMAFVLLLADGLLKRRPPLLLG